MTDAVREAMAVLIKGLDRWIGRIICPHHRRRLLAIEFDGECVYECVACKKHFSRSL